MLETQVGWPTLVASKTSENTQPWRPNSGSTGRGSGEGEGETDALGEALADGDWDAEGDTDADGVGLGEAEGDGESETDGETLALGLADSETRAEGDPESDADAEGDADALGEAELDGLVEAEGDGLSETLAEGEADADGLRLSETDALGDAVAEGEGDGDELGDGLGDGDGERLGLGDGLTEGETLAEGLGDADTEAQSAALGGRRHPCRLVRCHLLRPTLLAEAALHPRHARHQLLLRLHLLLVHEDVLDENLRHVLAPVQRRLLPGNPVFGQVGEMVVQGRDHRRLPVRGEQGLQLRLLPLQVRLTLRERHRLESVHGGHQPLHPQRLPGGDRTVIDVENLLNLRRRRARPGLALPVGEVGG